MWRPLQRTNKFNNNKNTRLDIGLHILNIYSLTLLDNIPDNIIIYIIYLDTYYYL